MFKKIIYMSIVFVSMLSAATVNTDKDTYKDSDAIVVSYGEMEALASEWIAIYPAGSTNDYGNIVKWKLTGANIEGSVTFDSLAIGIYDVRVFNSADFLVSKEITVDDNAAVVTTVETTQNVYAIDEQIEVVFDNMSGNEDDWIAIYPAGSTNDWANMLQWEWIEDGLVSGTQTFEAMPVGNYEVRVFFNNSFNSEAVYAFSIEENAVVVTVETTKVTYLSDEEIVVIFDNMSGNEDDWIGIYPAGSTNAWANMLQWKWVEDGLVSGTETFEAMPVGNYEVRVFFNNSFNSEAVYAFTVEAPVVVADLLVSKAIYDPFELIHTEYNNMLGINTEWIGIFLVNANHTKADALEWRDTKSLVSGTLSFNGLAAGNYEARSYVGNTLKETVPFVVQNQAVVRTLYDDFESGVIGPRWTVYAGKPMTLLNVGVNAGGVAHTERKVVINGQHSLRTYRDYRGGLNYAGYIFDFQNPDKKMKFLELDMKIGESSHVFAFGVNLKTKLGNRRIEFASWLNHTLPSGSQVIRGPYGNVLEGHRQAFTQDNYLHAHPGPSDYYVGTSAIGAGQNMFIHYKINIEEKLRVLEPDNELLGITYFTTSGGDYDNLALTSH